MASEAPQAAFDIGRVISRGFGTLGRRFGLFLALASLLAGLPLLLIGLVFGSPMERMAAGDVSFVTSPAFWGGILLFVLANYMLSAALIRASIRDLRDEPVEFGSLLVEAARLLLPLIGLTIVMSIGLIIGFMLLIVPGIILYVMWIMAVPVLVQERRGIFDCLARSGELTKGYRWWILLLVVLYIVLSSMVGMLLGLLQVPFGTNNLTAVLLINVAQSMLLGMVSSAVIASLYVELRMLKEGATSETLADIFA